MSADETALAAESGGPDRDRTTQWVREQLSRRRLVRRDARRPTHRRAIAQYAEVAHKESRRRVRIHSRSARAARSLRLCRSRWCGLRRSSESLPHREAFPRRCIDRRRRLSGGPWCGRSRSEEHTSELQSLAYLVCRLLLEKKK